MSAKQGAVRAEQCVGGAQEIRILVTQTKLGGGRMIKEGAPGAIFCFTSRTRTAAVTRMKH